MSDDGVLCTSGLILSLALLVSGLVLLFRGDIMARKVIELHTTSTVWETIVKYRELERRLDK